VLTVPQPKQAFDQNISGAATFEVGRVYNRRNDIHARFEGQRQGGICRTSSSSPARAASSTVIRMGGTKTASTSTRVKVRSVTCSGSGGTGRSVLT
jgi:hypothetical protein